MYVVYTKLSQIAQRGVNVGISHRKCLSNFKVLLPIFGLGYLIFIYKHILLSIILKENVI